MLTRRRMLSQLGAAGAAIAALRTSIGFAAAPSTVKTAVNFDIPRGACDCHVHIFDPAGFAYASNRVYTPPEATIADLRELQAALHFERVVIVTPSIYGTDNSCTLDAIRQLGARARGIAVIDELAIVGVGRAHRFSVTDRTPVLFGPSRNLAHVTQDTVRVSAVHAIELFDRDRPW